MNDYNHSKIPVLLRLTLIFTLLTLGGLIVTATPAQAQEPFPPGVELVGQFEFEEPETPPAAPSANPVASSTISFSQEATVSKTPLSLALTPLAAGTIKYTTNGATPDANSTPYQGPIPINETTVIRAQLFSDEGVPLGPVDTKSYIIADYEQTIPVISLVSDWGNWETLHTFAKERGLDWERPVNIEYFAENSGQLQFNHAAGVRIHGNFSRLFSPKKSYRIYFRKSYGGPGNLAYPLFEDSPVTSFDKIILKGIFQDAFYHRNIPNLSDKHHTARYINDQVTRNLHRDMGQPIAHGRWVLLYLNGDFWGLYNLTERIDLPMLRTYSDKNADWDVIVKESGWDEFGQWYNIEDVREGDYGAWLENQDWIGAADFTDPGNIGVLEWRVDMENIYSYMFLQAYTQNTDWPDANWVVVRRKDPGAVGNEGKWRMMIWDSETTFGSGADFRKDINTLQNVHSPHDSITRILEKPFIGSCALKHQFVQRAREYLGVENVHGKPPEQVGQLSKENIKAEIMTQAEIVRPFINMEAQRWAPDMGVANFDHAVNEALKFVDVREEVILNHLDILRYQTFTECQ